MSSIADAQNATKRLYAVFEAETQTEDKTMDADMQDAVVVENGEFTWDSPPPAEKSKKKSGSKRQSVVAPVASAETQKVFGMKDVNLTIPMGQLTAIVGPVGMGKTSLLEAMIGEMRKISGTVK